MTERGLKISNKTKGRKRTQEQRQNISNGVKQYLSNETAQKKTERLFNQRKACAIRSILYKEYLRDIK